ncbi:helix-turn-helix domain-containing protein [Clostridium sp. SHJSY1]|uniref:helix-turn-helix domain-containing protein n=1 Tax=Clostridium sp. SHJSY1 TaxID=2942483 RepID=UPI002876C083|nr:helix-turn-helix transcriptional regulator [Clostridium sp. SHJSY1]MDS0525366.1 helix-turn-helix domain-containing protein [Clostridium sp. SHJSY1]
MSRVGEKIKNARLKSGITQKVLAKKLGVSEKYINEVEGGRKVAQESFIDRAAKFLKVDLNDISMVVTDEVLMEERKQEKLNVKVKETKISPRILGETSEVWTDAFSSVLKRVNIYDYSLKNILGGKDLPNYSNKVEGYTADKVLYLKVSDNDMVGFRIMKDDIAFGHLVKEVSNGIFLIEYKGKRAIRQIKLIGNSRALLINNDGAVLTETIEVNNIKVIAKLERLEISL